MFFSISALFSAHKRVCGKQRADTNLAIENFNFQSFLSACDICVKTLTALTQIRG